ncbi:MAG: hypothetical protein ACP5NX_01600 [Candidatus Bilamarchaeaceae archaeon]
MATGEKGIIEDEIVHWWKDDKGEQHRTILRLEREDTKESNGFPRDGLVTLRIMNTVGTVAIKLNPDEALRVSHQIQVVARVLLNQKREMWNRFNE